MRGLVVETCSSLSHGPQWHMTEGQNDSHLIGISHLSNAHGILRSTADEVKLPEPPDLDGAVGLTSAAHRLVEGVAASLAGGSTQPLTRGRQEHR